MQTHASTVLRLLISVLVFGWIAATAEGQTSATQVVAMEKEPRHHVVFEANSFRILDFQLQPADTTLFHVHPTPVAAFVISRSLTRSQNLGSDWIEPRPTSESTNPTPTPVNFEPPDRFLPHRLNNIGSGLNRMIVVENRTTGDETATEVNSGFAGKAEKANRWFRAYRLILAKGEATGQHRHTAPVALIQASNGHALGAGAKKFELTTPGNVAWFDAGEVHEIRNQGDAPIELVEIEVRRPKQ
jgi:quercetin dioxygenase-like cupin family protein